MTEQDTSRYRLPPFPEKVQPLSNDQAVWLKAKFPSVPTSLKDCVTCHGTKSFRWFAYEGARTDRVVEYECSCPDQFGAHRVMLHSGIGLTFQRYGWADLLYKPQQAWDATMDYLGHGTAYVSNGFGLIYHGDRGNGKTLLANLLLKALMTEGNDVYATSFTEMIDTFAGGWKDKEERAWFNRRVRNAGVLLIDDIGRERNKGQGTVGETTLEEVVRHRVAQSMPTMLTTNLTPEKIAAGYGGHTMSLLAERATYCHFEGIDRRSEMNLRFAEQIRNGLTRPVVWE